VSLRARAARAPRSRERLGWWLDGVWDFTDAQTREVLTEVRARGDVLLAGGAQWCSAAGECLDGVVWAAEQQPQPLPGRLLAGQVANTLLEASAAAKAGMRFLCVRDPSLDSRALEVLSTVGLPLVVDATNPREGGHEMATTKLWWR
jgi:hypothetical protein